ncbi:Pycsar system effector family protein [Burkholderia ambifaria]|uniref:Pycsar system effector family protein n=1 Tax=Burkholderia ambifaria TaxID=152480 RepID=UPI00158A1AEA|nr:Pycsar system effector family protein [Burkholderia ambifaria]
MSDQQTQSKSAETEISSPPGISSMTILPASHPDVPPSSAEGKTEPVGGAASPPTYKFAHESHEYMREYIRNADQKAIFYFSICSTFLGFEHLQSWAARWTKWPTTWSMVDFASFVSMVGLALAAVSFLFSVMPRLGGSPRGFIFFKSVANYSNADQYISDIVKRQESDLAAEKLRHCYELAKIATSKYAAIGFGLRIAAVAIFCSLILFVSVNPTPSGSRQAPTGQTAAQR